ncbi:DUF2971 domain-containing protein [Butyrivibrio fibrisolvens]|uniref:DUF2971 domain-containing protein n=2 Tax=Butyrivibrio fibrisolvens TaxID=831 RepID=A0A317G1I2_BUTFI|nr:DUF2971 domain-containing protein [Butyrivibrio fibrisolvens]
MGGFWIMEKLFHYTSVSGFEGITNSKTLRFTKSDFLNDPTDCSLFINLIQKYLKDNEAVLEDIFAKNQGDRLEEIKTIYNERGCDLVGYVDYIHRHISLYVMSLTCNQDAMNMWNYYGQGGFELAFSQEKLIQKLKHTLVSEKEYITGQRVIYTNSKSGVDDISMSSFENFILVNKDYDNVFKAHKDYIDNKSYYDATQLYSTNTLGKFIEIYLKSYIATLKYLLSKSEINADMQPEEIFEKVFNNVSNLNGYYYWKHDLSLYMIVLSALIKSDSYEYEDEYRIVYFEYNVSDIKTKKEEYITKHIMDGDFICPYVTFKSDYENLLCDTLLGITISPVTRNLPINNNRYLDTLKSYSSSKGLTKNIDFSKHTIRW